MSVPAPAVDDVQAIWQDQILPLYFPPPEPAGPPVFVLLTGQPGAGASRITGRMLTEHPDITTLNADDLRAFYPNSSAPAAPGSGDEPEGLTQATAVWLREGMRYAREHHRSLLLEGTFVDSTVAAPTMARYAAEGFQTRLVVAASSRAESLMTLTSRYLRDAQAGLPARLIDRETHDSAVAGTRDVLAAFDTDDTVGRITVIDRHGRVLYDHDRTTPAVAAQSPVAAWEAAVSAPMGRFDATQWLSELRQVTRYAATRHHLPVEVTQLLVDLHQHSLREVIPDLQVAAGSAFTAALERETVARLVALRRSLPTEQVDAAAPVITPAGPDRGGVSR